MKKNWGYFFEVIIYLTILAIFLFAISRLSRKRDKEFVVNVATAITIISEQAYIQGQVDAMKGDIHIKQINDTTCVWIKSPYKSNQMPLRDTVIVK